ncbi:MAG: phosphatidate cytidylyltransferase [Bacteroidota bacterium]|nr:phosphatidate cytidylyltransferase [Bacteroidota bacterium]MDX5430790.1 phosphatidate cytidylyltransferase [Bacteroidota bacterium]MDX5469535.1 phosphatidate cytidylyltransferase [Bacteroidota bacterium]
MNNFWTRTLSGAIYAGAVIGALLLGLKYFIPLFAFVTAVCLWEFLKAETESGHPARILGIVGGTLLYIVSAYALMGERSLIWYLPFILSLPFLVLLLGLTQPKADHFRAVGALLTSYFYIVLPFILLTAIQRWHLPGSGLSPLLGIFILFWSNDTGAYLSGKSMGKHPLFPEVSPKKTIEGLIGGILLCLIAAYILSLYSLSFTLTQWLILGGLISVFGTLGDLIESMWKRRLGIKDSGNIMPGHGGLMDRFDGFFIALPAVHLYLFFLTF